MPPPCPSAPTITVAAPGYTGPERRRTETEWRAAVEHRFAAGSEKMDSIQRELQTNTQATTATQARVEEMLEFFESMKGAWKFFDLLGRLAKPVGAIAMAGAAVYSLWTAVKGHK